MDASSFFWVANVSFANGNGGQTPPPNGAGVLTTPTGHEENRQFFKSRLDIVPKEEHKSFLTYIIPHDREKLLMRFFDELEERKGELGISDIQLSLTTLEEVFLNIAKQAELESAAADGTMVSLTLTTSGHTVEVLEGKPLTCNIFRDQYAFNLFSHNAPVLSNGYNEEEMKLVKETRKIWSDANVKVTATCIRVHVMRAHAESVNLQFENPLDEDAAREILRNATGVIIIDDRAANQFPTPLKEMVFSLPID